MQHDYNIRMPQGPPTDVKTQTAYADQECCVQCTSYYACLRCPRHLLDAKDIWVYAETTVKYHASTLASNSPKPFQPNLAF